MVRRIYGEIVRLVTLNEKEQVKLSIIDNLSSEDGERLRALVYPHVSMLLLCFSFDKASSLASLADNVRLLPFL